MTGMQKLLKYGAIALAAFILVGMLTAVIGGLQMLSWVFDDGKNVGPQGEIALEQDFRELEIQLGASQLTIQVGERFHLETNHEKIRVRQTGGTLKIWESGDTVYSKDRKLTLTIPADYIFDSVELEIDAAVMVIRQLRCHELELEMAAGDIQFHDLQVTSSAHISTGAGRLQCMGTIRDLNLDMGVGAVTMEVKLEGTCQVSHGVGKLDVSLLGDREAYQIKVNKGLGKVSVDGYIIPGNQTIGSGDTQLQLDCGVGEVRISF